MTFEGGQVSFQGFAVIMGVGALCAVLYGIRILHKARQIPAMRPAEKLRRDARFAFAGAAVFAIVGGTMLLMGYLGTSWGIGGVFTLPFVAYILWLMHKNEEH